MKTGLFMSTSWLGSALFVISLSQHVQGETALSITADNIASNQSISAYISAGSSTVDDYAIGVDIATGLRVEGGVTAGATISAENNSSFKHAHGITLSSGAYLGDMAGDIVIRSHGMSNATGIFMHSGASMGEFSGKIDITANSGTSYGYVVGRTVSFGSAGLWNAEKSNSEGFSVDWSKASIHMSSNSGTTYGLYLQSEENMITQPIGGSIKSHNTGGFAHAIYYNQTDALQLQGGAYISATTGEGDNIEFGTAISNSKGISIKGIDNGEAITIIGNISASTRNALTFESGDYAISSDSWYCKSLTLGSDNSNAQVLLTESTLVRAESMNIYLNQGSELTQLIIANGQQLDLTSLETLTVHLGDGVDLTQMGSFDFIQGDILFDINMPEMTVLTADGKEYVLIVNDSGVSINYVPEPSTTTLSLLALAGLLARRRRIFS